MIKLFSPVLAIFIVIFCLFFAAKAMDNEGIISDPREAESIALKRSCGLGLTRLSLSDDAVDFSDEAKRAWGIYRSALWRKEVLGQSLEEVIDKFRNYGNACVGLVRMKQCREEAKSSEPLPLDVTDAHKKALDELRDLLETSDIAFLENLANDIEHRAYKLPKEH